MVKKVLMVGISLVVGLSLPALAVSSVELDKLTASDAAANDFFGNSVAISGNTAIVGAHLDCDAGTYSGSAYLFDVSDPRHSVEIAKLTASDAAAVDYFGKSVAISGNTAIVGAWGNDDAGSSSGSAYLFDVSDPCNPVEIAKLTASDAAANDNFGFSVAISGNTAIVGARWDDTPEFDSGSAYLYDFSGPNNIIETKLTASDGRTNDYFGFSVAISGTTAIVGAYGDDDGGDTSGSAYLFDVTTGSHIAKLTASDAAASDTFGYSVAISGAIALVGARGNDDAGSSSGSAYLFDAVTGSEIAKLTAHDAAADDYFGQSVAIRGATALVGAYKDDEGSFNSGSAYIFSPNDVDPNNWDQVAKLTASDAAASDRFGHSVAISGNIAIVGAHLDDDACHNNPACDSGSAYLFDVTAGPCVFPPVGDNNLDCRVDFRDFALMAGNWLLDCLLDPSNPACLAP